MRTGPIIGFCLIFLASLALPVAAGARPAFASDRHRFLEEHAERLGLDDETREEIRGLVEESRETNRELRGEVRDLHREMRGLLEAEDPDESAVMAQADAIGGLETELHKNRLATMLRIRARLSPEQRAKLVELRKEYRHHPSREEVAEACEADAEALCSDADGRWARRRCMFEQREKLSEGCREAFADLRDRPHRRHFGDRHAD
ncbi:MAG: Spy/CpxP family protein refolding chaperone [Myxococcota bacterium]